MVSQTLAEPARDTRAATAPLRPVKLGPADVVLDRRSDGTLHLRSPHPLARFPEKLTERLEHWAKAAPDRVFIAQRTAAGDWRKLTYAQTLSQVRGIAQALLDWKLSPERPIAILSGNDIEHALLGLAAMVAGIPYAPISVPYSLMSTDFGQVKSIIADLTPGLVFVADGKPFARAIDAAVPLDAEIVVTANPLGSRSTTLFADLLATEPTAAVDAAHARSGPAPLPRFCSPPDRP